MSIFEITNTRIFAIILLILSSAIIASALFIDVILGFDPCILCLYERVPYFFIAGLSFLLMMTAHQWHKIILVLIIVTSFVGASIAIYHSGIERKLWHSITQCTQDIQISDGLDFEEFKNTLQDSKIGDCSKPAFVILGLSLAEINALINIVLIIYTIIFMRRL